MFNSCRNIHVKLHLDRPGATNFITSFDHECVHINQSRYSASLIVLADRLIGDGEDLRVAHRAAPSRM